MLHALLARYGRHVPNALGVLRLGVAIWFPVAPHEWRLALVLIGGLSDALDGFIARRLHASSWVGALLDVVADKLFTLSVVLTLAIDGPLSWPLVAGLLARDVVNAVIAAYLGAIGRWELFRRVAARMSGKITTMAIFVAMVAVVWRPELGLPLAWVAVATSVVAAGDYAMVFARWRERDS